MFSRYFGKISVVIFLIIGSLGCSRSPDVAGIINNTEYDKVQDDCDEKELRATCVAEVFEKKTDKYCADKGLNSDVCLSIKTEVLRSVVGFQKQRTEELKRSNEIIKKKMQEFKSQH